MDEGRPPDPALPDAAGGADHVPAADPFHAADAAAYSTTEDVALEPRRPGRISIAIVIVVAIAFISFAVVGGTIITSPPSPTPRPELRLAVTDGAGKLHTMDPAGKSVRDYDLPGVEFGFPTWSPDGTRIGVTGSDKDSTAIYVFDAADAAANPAIVYDSADAPPFYAYWSPDGRQIAFLAQEPDRIALEVAPADGSAKAKVVREGAPLYWDWLDSNHLVAHVGLTGEGSFLGELDLDGAPSGSVSLEPGIFRSPAVSHDRAYRGYVATNHDSTGIVTVESADQSHRETTRVFGVAAVSFDPTGETLAYVGAERPFVNDPGLPLGPLRVIDPTTGQTRRLLEGEVLAFFWSPDGKTIAALSLSGPGEQIVGVPGAELAAARDPTIGAELGPSQAGSGLALTLSFVDVASGSVRTKRAAQVTSRFVNNILPYYDQYALSHRIWAPDSSAIALPLVANGKDQLFVIPAAGSDATPLDGAQLGFWSP